MKNVFRDITIKHAEELAKLSSGFHGREHYKCSYVGMRFEYKGFFLVKPKQLRKKSLQTDFHVVLIQSITHALDRFFVINSQRRNAFILFNIENGKNKQVEIFQDDLFQMYKFLIANKYNIA